MGFAPGNKLAGSRAGVPNKRTQEVRELLAGLGYCPTQSLVEISKIAMTRFVEELQLVESGRYSPMESGASAYLKMALDCAKELAGYVNPKLKSIEQVRSNPTEGMSPQQRLEAMKQAVLIFEANLKEAKDTQS